MDSSPAFLYYNPEGPTQSRHQFVSQPPNQKTTTTTPEQHHASAASSTSMPFPSALVYQSRPSSSHMKPQHIHAPTPIIATSVESLQKSSGLLTPSSPNLLGLDGPNGGDMYFFPPTSTPELNNGMHTPLHSPWGLDETCSGTVTPSDMQLSPSTPDVWKARSPMSPGTQTSVLLELSNLLTSLACSIQPSNEPFHVRRLQPDIDAVFMPLALPHLISVRR